MQDFKKAFFNMIYKINVYDSYLYYTVIYIMLRSICVFIDL